MARRRTPPDLSTLAESWAVHLRAEGRSPETIKSYRAGVAAFVRWCEQAGKIPQLDRATVAAFIAGVLDGGAQTTTARARQLALRRFSSWLVEEGEIPRDELTGLKPPKLDQKITPRLTDEQVIALLRACSGKDFGSRRDDAILRLMFETAARAGEMVAMQLDDVDLTRGIASIRRGKGGRGRVAPFGPQTGRAIDRYLRLRRSHRLAETTALWLGVRGKAFGYHGLYDALARRAEVAGITGFHPHLLRHTAAQRWLSAGGSEGGLMSVAGWKRREMLDRYTRVTASERAIAESRKLNLGEFS